MSRTINRGDVLQALRYCDWLTAREMGGLLGALRSDVASAMEALISKGKVDQRERASYLSGQTCREYRLSRSTMEAEWSSEPPRGGHRRNR